MQNPILHTILNNSLWVSPERCLYWEDQNTLIVADLHLGKSGHFRKAGIAIPQTVYKADLQRLIAQLYFYKAERLIITGDFTHSIANRELDLFIKWRKDFSMLHIDLVKGNHDILNDDWYEDADVTVHLMQMNAGPFLFIHDLKELKKLEEFGRQYIFSGHLHPAVSIRGRGKQALRFPCFYFTKEYCVLPAFSRFSGTFKVEPGKDEIIYAIVEDGIMQI